MKKNVFVWLLGFFAAITICLKSGTSVRAFAATNYYLEVSVLSASEAAAIDPSGTMLQGGDYKVSFCVDVDPNAQKPIGFGLNFTYNSSYFAPIHDLNALNPTYIAFHTIPSAQTGTWDVILTGVNENQSLLAITVSSTNVINFSSGEAICMYLHPTTTPVPSDIEVASNLCIRNMTAANKTEMSQSEYTPTHDVPDNHSYHDIHYIVGDINNDGAVDSSDYLYFLSILQIHSSYTSNSDVTTYLTSSDAPGLLITEQIVGTKVIFKVGDVNNDGVINSQDANLVLQYYQDDLLGILTGNEYIGSEWIARFVIISGGNFTLDSTIPA